ncbi:MAG: lipopolysaccharide heptosyltransferase II [Candidatus Omnitrophica bacterium]|nr:lipopolysaccharide heptosyltransferase II [Candidatus Omnitrophota bacterium]
MNILQILPELKSGGVETGVVDLTKELIAKGHKAVVISAGGSLVGLVEKIKGIHYKLPVDKKNPVTIIKMVREIINIIKKEKIDIVHARSRVPAISAFFACYFKQVPLVTTCHGYYSKHFFSQIMGWGKLIIVPSEIIAKHMIEDFGTPRSRIRLIPRGVNLEAFEYNQNCAKEKKEYTIGVIARITPLKGHAYFLRAIAKIVKTMPNVKVFIVGDAPENKKKYKMELMTMVNRLSIARYINFLGTRSDIPKVLSTMDLLVLPTITPEAFGRVIIEAFACGVPVVATKVGGIVDIIKHEKNGLLIPPADHNAMAEAMTRILKDRKLAADLAQQARQDVERNFSLEKMYKKTITVYEEAKSKINILVIKIGAVGDVILSVPALAAIRRHFPKAKITILVGAKSREIAANCPYVDELIVFNDVDKKNTIKKICDVSRQLRREYFDMSIDLQNNRTSRLLALFSVSPRRIGYKTSKFDMLLTDKVRGARARIAPVEHQFKLLEVLGIKGADPALELFPSEEEKRNIEKVLDAEWVSEKQILVGINIGSSIKWQTKRWPPDNIIKLCRKFSQKDIRIVITGSKNEMPLAENLVTAFKSKPINMTGRTTLMELAWLIKKCNLFITADSAPLHIAVAMKTPCIALFGPTDPTRHLQPVPTVTVIRKGLRCSPCYKKNCRNLRCMERITVEEVYETAMKILETK